MYNPHKADYIYWMIKDAFPNEKSFGFDLDASPLAKHKDQDIVENTLGKNMDGYIYFHSNSDYK